MARMPEHVHEPYTREDDAFLWANRGRPAEEVAAELGRGAKSCSNPNPNPKPSPNPDPKPLAVPERFDAVLWSG